MVEEKQSHRVNYKWFIIYSTEYHIAIFTDIMDNLYFTGYSKSFKIVGLSSWCLICALIVQGLNCTDIINSCPLFAQLLHTAHCTAIFTDIMDNLYFTGYSKSFKIVGLSSWCLICALIVQGLNCTDIINSCPLFAQLLHTAQFLEP